MPAGSGLPLERSFSASSSPTPPAHWQAPPDHTPDGAFCFVGIPARMEHINRSRYVREGYAGVEVLAAVEGLSATDLADLNECVDDTEDLNEYFLRPRTGSPPSDAERETILGSVQTHRDLASLFMVYEPRNLAQRTFSMTTFMRRLLIKYRLMRDEVRTLGSSAVEQLLQVQKENEQLKTHFAQLNGQWEAICKNQQATADATAERCRYDFKRLMAEHETEKRALRDQVAKRDRQLRTAGLVADSLEARSLNVDRAMTFLNCHQTQVTGNWRRLEDQLKHHNAGTFPPSEWKTLINVTSADGLFTNPGPYVSNSGGDTDTEEKGDGGPESGGDGTGSHVRHTVFLDLTGDPSSGDSLHEEPRPKKASRARKVPDFIQARPTRWDPTQQRARPAAQDYLVDEKATCASLAGLPVVWRTLRTDVQLVMPSGLIYRVSMKMLASVMRFGLTYRASMKLLESGNTAHALFMAHDLADMLARMMFWNKVDETDWTRFVPELYYLRAENGVDVILLLGSDDEEEVDKEKRDATWTPSKKAQAKIAQTERRETEVQEWGQDEKVLDEDEEEAPLTPTRRSKRKLDSASSQSDSAPSAPVHQGPRRRRKLVLERPGGSRPLLASPCLN
ncbi:uncharacterized protein IUM83_16395 [Phytophthora cinnamomi]|uniref:uncharacterized protein n=1 Tax=Phytophthora cinnamomi TaxID=4785 RepID=UPI0035595CFA|nr:hypothetical protein IUM83_16395 [Phytophthora cinnamomi]